MKHKTRLRILKISGLSAAIGLALILTACSAASTGTPTPSVATVQPATSASPTTLPPAQRPVQPTAAAVPADPASTPTVSASDLPSCVTPAPLTPAQTEGPYYKQNSPERASLIEPGMSGTRLIVTGYVLTTDCRPIANAWLDFWQADDQGVYDNTGYRLRGHLFADKQGRYTLETIVPGEYPGRTQHIHVKVRAPDGPILTTQLYFPGAPGNDRDSIFDPALLADVRDSAGGKQATFNFVVKTQ